MRAYPNTSEADVSENRVSVTLSLAASQRVQQCFDTPCWGPDAKALWRARLKEEFNVDAALESYQQAPGEPKLWLEDDAAVARGSVLNFGVKTETVLSKRSKHDKMLAMLSAPMLQDLVRCWAARLLAGQASAPAAVSTELQALVASNPIIHQSLSAALVSINAKPSAEQVAEALDSTYQRRCGECSPAGGKPWSSNAASGADNSTAMLRGQMEQMREAGMLEVLKKDFPVECLIVQHYEVFMQMLA